MIFFFGMEIILDQTHDVKTHICLKIFDGNVFFSSHVTWNIWPVISIKLLYTPQHICTRPKSVLLISNQWVFFSLQWWGGFYFYSWSDCTSKLATMDRSMMNMNVGLLWIWSLKGNYSSYWKIFMALFVT
jgi:hypothetical protein